MKKLYLLILCVVALVFEAGAQSKPNIILIMADDLGWGDVGFNGNKTIKTPYLDKMALEGIKFERFYAGSAECSPTRASVLTGRTPFRQGVFRANTGILRPEEITLPEVLKSNGYYTGHFGKWHLGSLTATESDANRGKPGNTQNFNPPSVHGYDEAFVTESKVPTWDPMKKPVGRAAGKGWDYLKEGEKWLPFGTSYWDIKGNKVRDNLDGDDSRIIMDRVLPFIDRAEAKNDPFLAVVWFHAPHMPCVAGPKYQAMYPQLDPMEKNYAGCITAMDEQIGRLRDYLKSKNIDKNTIILFCSDNGPEDGFGTAGPYLGRKRSLHEGGVRVPGVLVWPQAVPKPFVTTTPCVTTDILPTVLDILKLDKAKTVPYALDGLSMLPVIRNQAKVRDTPVGFFFPGQASYSDNRFKLYSRGGVYELYDMLTDPYETKDIKEAHADVVTKMKASLKTLEQSCHDSFDGKEYGTASVERMKQQWADPYKPAKNETKD